MITPNASNSVHARTSSSLTTAAIAASKHRDQDLRAPFGTWVFAAIFVSKTVASLGQPGGSGLPSVAGLSEADSDGRHGGQALP